jgi:hypothetical protein
LVAAIEAVIGLAEMKDRTARVESDVAGLRAGMTDGSAKVEELGREVVGLKARPSNCCLKVKKDMTNLERELGILKEEMRGHRVQEAAMAGQRLQHEQEIREVNHEVELLQKVSDDQRKSQERETQAVAEV